AAPAMVTIRYTEWDGTQKLKLDADKVFEKLAEYLSYTDDVRQAMDWLERERRTLEELSAQKPGMEQKQRELQRMPRRLSEAIRKLESYEFEDAQARADFDELLAEYENVRDLENFRERNQHLFH